MKQIVSKTPRNKQKRKFKKKFFTQNWGLVRSAEHIQPTWGKWEFHPHNTLIDFRIQKCTSQNCFTDVFSQTDFYKCYQFGHVILWPCHMETRFECDRFLKGSYWWGRTCRLNSTCLLSTFSEQNNLVVWVIAMHLRDIKTFFILFFMFWISKEVYFCWVQILIINFTHGELR